jgi:Kef-type K+ transport system membrane component KefB
MRPLVRLVVLGLVMALVHRFTAAGSLEARATLALGFLLLAAHPGGDLASRAGVPRLTGYLLLGFIVGPAWLGLVRADEVAALGFIGDAAVALIALAAGGALRLESLRADRGALVRLSAGAILFPAAAVALVTASVAPWFPVTVHLGAGDAIAVALVLATIAAASSPALTMAVTQELGVRGPFARTVLTVTVVQDVAVIVLLTVVLTVARLLASDGALHAGVAGGLLVHAVSAVAVGAVFGALVARYLRIVERASPLFLVAVAFCAAEVGRLLGLETLLIALSAGFFIENVSRAEGALLGAALSRGPQPVHALFFALAGAGLQLDALRDLWPWVLLLVGLRVWGLRVGLRWAGGDPNVTPTLAQHGWLGLISQGGVALGLAAVARRAFPAWGVSLEAFIVTMTGVQELAGPVCLRRALALVGELKEGHDVKDAALVGADVVAVGRGGL